MLNIFFPGRNTGIGFRIPFIFKSHQMWRKYQTIFYLVVILIVLVLYILKVMKVISASNYAGFCIFSIIVSAVITTIIYLFNSLKTKSDAKKYK